MKHKCLDYWQFWNTFWYFLKRPKIGSYRPNIDSHSPQLDSKRPISQTPNSDSNSPQLDFQRHKVRLPEPKFVSHWQKLNFQSPKLTLKGPLSAPRCLKINSQIRIYDTNRLNSTTTPEHKIISQRPIDSNNLSSKGKKMNFQRPYHFKRTTIDSMRSKNRLPNVHIVPKMNYQNTKSTSKGPKSTPVTRKQLQLVQNSQI